MPSAAQLRVAIEATLARRTPAALTPRPQQVRPVAATGIASLDALLGGGLPIGAISEIVGREGYGHTTLALSFLAGMTQAGQVCAWVDVSDALHPESAAAAGLDLDRLLWVRCGEKAKELKKKTEPGAGALLPQQARPAQGGGSPHPRNEVRGLDTAVEELMRRKEQFVRDKRIGTPGMSNVPLAAGHTAEVPANRKKERIEQVPWDRLPARRGDSVLQQGKQYAADCAEPQRRVRPEVSRWEPAAALHTVLRKAAPPQVPWTRLEQALRATDLLLQAGGFGAIVLDMGSIAAEYSTRVPLATWFRYRAAAERTRATLLLLTQQTCANSAAGLVLRLSSPQESAGAAHVFNGLDASAELVRKRFDAIESNLLPLRKQPRSAPTAEWRSSALWATAR